MAAQGRWFGLKTILIGLVVITSLSLFYEVKPIQSPHWTLWTFILCPKVPKNGQKSVFTSQIAVPGQWSGLKTILFDSVIGSYIPKDFSMSSNKFSPLTGSSGPSFLAQKCPKIPKKLVFPFKMAAQVQWFGLKPILIGYISGYCISNDFLWIPINSVPSPSLTGFSGPSFRARKFQFFFKNGGSRSIIWIKTDIDRFY